MIKYFTFFVFAFLTTTILQAQSCTTFLNQNEVLCMTSKDNFLWIGTRGGLVKFDTITNQKTIYTKENSTLPQNTILHITTDKLGNLWMSTTGELLVKYDGFSFSNFPSKGGDIEFVGDTLYTFNNQSIWKFYNNVWTESVLNYTGMNTFYRIDNIEKYNNKLYISVQTYTNSALFHLDFVRFNGVAFTRIISFDRSNPILDTDVTGNFKIDSQGNIWLALFEGGLKMITPSLSVSTMMIPISVRTCPNIYIVSIEIKNTRIFFGGAAKNGLITYDINTATWNAVHSLNSSMPETDVNAIVPITNNTAFVGNQMGLVKTRIDNKQCNIFRLSGSPYNIFRPHGWNMIKNRFYVSGKNDYFSDSLKVYDVKTLQWKNYDELAGIYVNKIVEDKEHMPWLVTDQGLYSLDTVSDVWIKFTMNYADTIKGITNMLFDRYGNKWLMTGFYGVIRIDVDGTTTHIYKCTFGRQFNDLCTDGQFIYAAGSGTNNGILKVSLLDNSIQNLNLDNYGGNVSNIKSLFFGNDTVYYCTDNIFGKISNGVVTRKYQLVDLVYLNVPRAPVQQLAYANIDKDGDVWFTDEKSNKLWKYRNGTFSSYNYSNSCLSNISVSSSIICDSMNRLIIYGNGDGLYIFDKTGTYTPVTTGIIKPQPYVVESKVEVFPNPTSDVVFIRLDDNSFEIKNIIIKDIHSNEVMNISNKTNSKETKFSVGSLKTGMYILQLESSDGRNCYRRIIKL